MVKKIKVGSTDWDDKVMEVLSHKTMSVAQLQSWTTQLVLDSNHLLDATFTEDNGIEFEAKAGSDIGNVGRALYNFAILFEQDTSAKFNGLKMVVQYLEG